MSFEFHYVALLIIEYIIQAVKQDYSRSLSLLNWDKSRDKLNVVLCFD